MSALRTVRSIEVVVAAFVLACFVTIGWLDYSRRSHAAERFDTFSSYDYQRGGYHAWYDLLQREGIGVVRLERRPAYLNNSVGTFIVANNMFDALLREQAGQSIGYYTGEDLDRLHAWVQHGGRLIWLIDQGAALAMPDTGQKLRQLTGQSTSSLHLPPVARAGTGADAARPMIESPLTEGVQRLSGTSHVRIPFDADARITPLVGDRHGIVVGFYDLGKGSVVIVTDESLFDNARLTKADNARLAYNLATAGLAPGSRVAFDEWTHGYTSGDTWWAITPLPLRIGLAIAAGALLLLLAGAMWRFGPTAKLPENIERTSDEYLVSMAALLDRGAAARKAVADLSHIALHAVARSVGLPDASPASAIAARLRGTDAGDRRADEVMVIERIAGYEHPTARELVLAAQLSHDLRKEFHTDAFALKPRRTPTRRSA